MLLPRRLVLSALLLSTFSQAFVLILPNAIGSSVLFSRTSIGRLQFANGNSNDVRYDEVSDAEAVLSCQSYLKRHKRLEWVAGEERKRQRRSISPSIRDGNAAVGFFWEDPSKLKYLQESNPKRNSITGEFVLSGEADELDFSDDRDEEEEEAEEEIWETVINSRSAVQRFSPPKQDDNDEMEDFATIDGAPTTSHIRRSRAAKRRWSDPEWRTAWYARRWGGKVQSNKEQRKLEERMRNVNVDKVLAECASLTEDEIANAIQTYVVANRRRSESRRTKNATATVLSFGDPILNQQWNASAVASHMSQQEMLKQRRQERARRATLAYQRRLENQKQHNSKARQQTLPSQQHRPMTQIRSLATPPPRLLLDRCSPLSALERIEWDLNHNCLPNPTDVQVILQPKKMKGRKQVLRRILSDVFDLRGKCIPVQNNHSDDDDDESAAVDYLFVTQSTIEEIGAFVMDKLRQKIEQQQHNDDTNESH